MQRMLRLLLRSFQVAGGQNRGMRDNSESNSKAHANVKKKSSYLSLCKRARAHFTDKEGLLLGVSTVNTHHSGGEEKNTLGIKQRNNSKRH